MNLFFFYILCQDEESSGEEEEKKAEEKEEKAISLFGALKIPGVVEFSLWYDPPSFFSIYKIKAWHQFLSFSLFFSKLVAYTFLYWLPNYIHETSGVPFTL